MIAASMSHAFRRFEDPTRLAAAFVIASSALCSCNRSGGTGPVPGPSPTVEMGDSAGVARSGYVGSLECAPCHRAIFDDYMGTFHELSLRRTDRPGATGRAIVADSNQDGIDDFAAGLDLAAAADFAVFGASAPRLSIRGGDPSHLRVAIGAVTYDVERTYGGNGAWKQVYVTRIGQSHYVLPIQWNETSRTWVGYRTEDWYDAANQPKFSDPATVAGAIDKTASFEQRCSGCHHLGLELDVDLATSEVVAGYRELSNGCESCHGPGATHVARAGGFGGIVNPRGLVDGTSAGIARADETCGRCHVRGTGDPLLGATTPLGFPWSAARGGFEAGNVLSDFFTPSSNAEDYWGRNAETGQFVTSRSNYQHLTDKENGPHGSTHAGAPTCFDCHDPHRRTQVHQIRETVTYLGVAYRTRSNDDTLCLACHHGVTARRDWRTVSDDDVHEIARSGLNASVRDAIVQHLANVGMPVSGPAAIDPDGPTHVGRCLDCHMPFTATSAQTKLDAAGFVEGDLHGHTVNPVHPNVSFDTSVLDPNTGTVMKPGVTNSCSATGCHPLSTLPNDPGWMNIVEWAQDADDQDMNFHGATPLASETAQTGGGRFCAECHTTEGFVRTQVDVPSQLLDAKLATTLVEQSIGRHEGITCQACHGTAPGSRASAPGTNNLRFPGRDLCAKCHTASDSFAAFANSGGIVRHAQIEMLSGTGGAEAAGEDYLDSGHTIFTDPVYESCAMCHVADSSGNTARFRERTDHRFEPKVATCVPCHTGSEPTVIDGSFGFYPMARGDYDGSGSIDSVDSEVLGLVDVVRFAVLDHDPRLELDADLHFAFMGSTVNVNRANGFSEETLRAIYDVYFVENDKSKGSHNLAYAVQLLQRAYVALTGTDIPGADPYQPPQ
ncbi:MAG: hypothetical protein HYR85_20800 [Planctomycetes bacterium]|nr:hypothetical protein [Planctomycetota bacterium]